MKSFAFPRKKPSTNVRFLLELVKFCDEEIGREKFLKKWQKYGEGIKLDDLYTDFPAQKGRSVMLLLADAATQGTPEPLISLWAKFKDELPLNALLDPIPEGPYRGLSALWLIAYGTSDNPQLFLDFWQQHGANIPLAALCVPAEEDGIFPLWSLADAASRGNPEPFKAVYAKYSSEFSLELLQIKLTKDQESILSLLAERDELILKEILSQTPGIITDVELTASLKKLPESGEGLLKLISARNAYFTALEKAKEGGNGIDEALLQLGGKATKAGYKNAAFDIALIYKALGRNDSVYTYCKLVSSESRHFQDAMLFCTEYEYALAKKEPADSAARCRHLHTALFYTLKVQHEQERIKKIQSIATLYILNNDECDPNVVSLDLIKIFNHPSQLNACFVVFDLIKQGLKMKAELAEKNNQKVDKNMSATQSPLDTPPGSPILTAYQNTQAISPIGDINLYQNVYDLNDFAPDF